MSFALSFSVYGYRFHAGLDALIQSYHHANEAVLQREEAVKQSLVDYHAAVAHGEPRDGEWDDEGHTLWERDDLLTMDIETAEEAVYELRRAILIGIYHHWERAMRIVTGDYKGHHPDLIKKAPQHKIQISPDLVKVVRAANALKHNNDARGNEALLAWPDIFPSGFQPRTNADWYSAIRPSDAHIEQAINIVAASGPKVNP